MLENKEVRKGKKTGKVKRESGRVGRRKKSVTGRRNQQKAAECKTKIKNLFSVSYALKTRGKKNRGKKIDHMGYKQSCTKIKR